VREGLRVFEGLVWLDTRLAQARWPRHGPAQSTVEYALIGALIIVAASLAVGGLGGEISNVFNSLTAALQHK
jgi:Flp pilus assembly pilin Flp